MKTRVTIITEQFVSDLVQVTESTIKDIEERGAVIISVSQFHEISKYLAIMIVYKEN